MNKYRSLFNFPSSKVCPVSYISTAFWPLLLFYLWHLRWIFSSFLQQERWSHLPFQGFRLQTEGSSAVVAFQLNGVVSGGQRRLSVCSRLKSSVLRKRNHNTCFVSSWPFSVFTWTHGSLQPGTWSHTVSCRSWGRSPPVTWPDTVVKNSFYRNGTWALWLHTQTPNIKDHKSMSSLQIQFSA